MADEKKVTFDLVLNKGLGLGETMQARMLCYAEDTKEQIMDKISMVFGLFDGRIEENNKRTLEINKMVDENLKKEMEANQKAKLTLVPKE